MQRIAYLLTQGLFFFLLFSSVMFLFQMWQDTLPSPLPELSPREQKTLDAAFLETREPVISDTPTTPPPDLQDRKLLVLEKLREHEAKKYFLDISLFPEESLYPHASISLIERMLATSLFRRHALPLSILLDFDRVEPRGQYIPGRITLQAELSPLEEMMKVLVHEIGHKIDIEILSKKKISSEFYGISWESTLTKKPGSNQADFVSGYAMTNQYEDFAETYTFFVFHNATMQERAQGSSLLQKKYDFFATRVFSAEIFQESRFEQTDIPVYIWDTTKIRIFLENYLQFLEGSYTIDRVSSS